MMILNLHTKLQQYLCGERRVFLGGVYMTPGRLSPRSEYTPVPSDGSIFVYMIPPQNVMPAQVTPAWVHPGSCTGARISLRYEIWQRYHVNAKRPPVSVWNTGTGSACVMFAILNHTCTFKYQDMKWLGHNVNPIRNQKVIPVWDSRRCEFSHVNTPVFC